MHLAAALLAFAALVVLALLYTVRGIPPAFAPFCAVSTVVLCLAGFGCLGLLPLGAGVLYALGAVGGLYLLWRCTRQKRPLPPLGFAFWFFVLAGLALIGLLWAKQPMFTSWDEFSFWGSAAKLMKLNNELYTTAPIGWPWPASQKPALPAFGYFFQFFGRGFAPWAHYAACDIFEMAAIAAVLAPLGKKQWNVALPLAFAALVLPFMFQHYATLGKLSPVYLDSLADLPLGFAFAAALCCWFAQPGCSTGMAAKTGLAPAFLPAAHKKSLPATGQGLRQPAAFAAMLPLCLALACLVLIKETGLALALVVCVLVFADIICQNYQKNSHKTSPPPGLRQRALQACLCLLAGVAASLGAYLYWAAHLSRAAGVSSFTNLGGKQDISMLAMPFTFFKELLSPQKTEFFTSVTTGMWRSFFTSKNSMFGTGFVVVLGILALLALAALFANVPLQRRSCLVFAGFSLLGFVAYYLLITMTYLYIFRPEQALAQESYERYIYPYYMGWFLCALALLAKSAGAALRLRRALANTVLLALCCAMLLRTVQMVPLQNTVLGVHWQEYNTQRYFAAQVQGLAQRLQADDRIFFVKSDDDGLGWFMYSYEFLPLQLDYSFGGGEFMQSVLLPCAGEEKQLLNAQQWAHYLLESGCTVVYIEYADAQFKQRYGAMFADDMSAYENRQTNLYAVAATPGGLQLQPMY